ncbi:centromere protein T [Tenrec ecaudatus]|uniref:centromere protein T n=1 Tax=Tenrec ecaudatus TaxID=94439 RepID=UPI003F59EB90
MAGSFSPDSDPTTRTLLRRVLDSTDPQRPRSPGPGARSPHSSQSSRTLRSQALRSAQRAGLETLPSRGSHTKASAQRQQRHSHGARAIGRWPHVPASGHLEEQTPRTLLKNILLTAPESSMVMPRPAAGTPVLAPPVVQPSRRESSRGSLDLQLPELEPPTSLAAGVLAPGRRKRLRLSAFQQEVDQGLPLSQESPKNSDPPSLTSSLSLTFGTPLQSQSVKRPGLARRPPARRAIDVAAFLRDLQDSSATSGALALEGDSHRTPGATLPKETMLEDTQFFSPPLVGHSFKAHLSLPAPATAPTTSGAAGAQRPRGRRTWSGRMLQDSPECAGSPKPSQLPTGRLEAASPQAVGFPSLHSGLSGEDDGVEPFGDGADEHAEEGKGDVRGRTTREASAGAQGAAGAEASEQMEASGSPEAVDPGGSSWPADSSVRTGSPQLAPKAPESLQARQLHHCVEPAPPAKLPPRPRAAGPRPRPDPYKAGLSHYGKLFSFFAKMPLEKAALEMVEKCLDKYFQHLYNDLEVFAAHAGRKTVQLEDLELLMRRQGLVTEQVSLHVLVERYLPLEYRQLLIPCASSGNAVFPAQ